MQFNRLNPMRDRLYLEKKLAEILGLQRDDLRHARKNAGLKKGPDFLEAADRSIVLTGHGFAKILEFWRATGVNFPAADDPDWDKLVAAAEIGLTPEITGNDPDGSIAASTTLVMTSDLEAVALRVIRIFPNPHLLEARYEIGHDGRRVTVSVPTNRNFVPNMRILGRPKAPGSSSFDLVGRCPRQKGKALPR